MFPSCLCCSSLAPAFRSLSEILGKGRYIHAWHHLFLKWLWQTFKRHLECGLSPALLRQTRDIQRPLLRLHDCWHHDMWLLSTAWTQYQLANSLLSQNNQFRCFFSSCFCFPFQTSSGVLLDLFRHCELFDKKWHWAGKPVKGRRR